MKYETLHVDNVSKARCGHQVLDEVCLDVYRGELHMVIGACGAGKTTLARLVTGLLGPDAGRLYFKGEPRRFAGAQQAVRQGIRLMGARSSLVADLSVMDNILLGREPVRAGCLVKSKQAEHYLKTACERMGLAVDLSAKAEKLRYAQGRLVELLKLWYARCPLIVLDDIGVERFAPEEIAVLQEILRSIKRENGAILYLSREVDEVAAVADCFSLLRRGRIEHKAHTPPRGWAVPPPWTGDAVPPTAVATEPHVLQMQGVCTATLRDLSLAVRPSEIVGVAGAEQADCLELARVLCGRTQVHGGQMLAQSRPVKLGSPADAMRGGVVTIFGKDVTRHVIPDFDMPDYVTLPLLRKTGAAGMVNRQAQRVIAEKCLQAAGIPHDTRPEHLSNHEMTRLLLAQCEWTKPRLIVGYEITHDVPAVPRRGIYETIRAMAAKGYAFLLISEAQDELRSLCARTLTLENGRIKAAE